MLHVMFDLETFGTTPCSAIRSIGAVEFAMDGAIGYEFYRNIDEKSCDYVGLYKEQSTVDWWAQQSPEAQASLLVDPQPVEKVVRAFHEWFLTTGATFIWCHGENFDEPLWNAVARAVGVPVPWKFWNARCTRTAYHLMNFDPRSIPREGVYHNALDDAKYQAKCVIAAVKK